MARCGHNFEYQYGERWFRQLHESVDLGHRAPRQHRGVHRVGLGECLPRDGLTRDGLTRISEELSGRLGIVPDLCTEFLESVELLLAAQAIYGLDD